MPGNRGFLAMVGQTLQNITFIEPSFYDTMKVWWAWTWRTSLWALAAWLAVGLVTSVQSSLAQIAVGIVGNIAGIYVLRTILRKDFGNFRIRLFSNSGTLEPTFSHALRVWWAWAWCALVFFVGLYIILIGIGVIMLNMLYVPAIVVAYLQLLTPPIAASLVAFRSILWTPPSPKGPEVPMDFGDFRICLVSKTG